VTLAVLELLDDGDLWTALGAGAAATAIVASFGRRPRRRRPGTRVPLAGFAVAVPALAVIAVQLHLPDGLLVGLLVVAAAGLLVDVEGVPAPMGLLVAAPGAWLLAWHGGVVPVTWIRVAVFTTTLLGGAALASFDDRFARRGYAPGFFALATVGVYYTVPDPYHALLLMGCALPATFLGWPRALARFGWSGALVCVGLLAWVVAVDGFGRQSSIIGGLASLGLLAIEPCWRGFRRRAWSPLDALPRGSWRWPTALGAQLACVYVASRVAGVRDVTEYDRAGPLWRGRVAGAVAIVLAAVVVASLIVALVRASGRGRAPSR
jgi:hypothetical protein